MNYLATILLKDGSSTKLFKNMEEAKRWLDESKKDPENETYVDIYDENWQKIKTVPYAGHL